MRLIAYIRVSRKNGRSGDSYLSPTIQRDAIERWAEAHGHEIVAWITEEDRSGKRGSKRPEFESALSRVTDGECDGIAVWKYSRFGRSLVESATRIQQIEDAGGIVASATEGTSKLTRNIMLAIAEDEIERMTEMWADARTRAASRGVHLGRPPLGYVKDDAGALVPHEVYGNVIRETYRRAARDGIGAAMAYLRVKVPERTWDTDKVRKLLKSRTYLGGPHKSLTTLDDHTAAQRAPRSRRANGSYLLSGIAQCGTCRQPLHGQLQTVNGRSYPRYRCSNRACRGGSSILAERLDKYVRDALKVEARMPGWRLRFVPGDLDAARAELELRESDLATFLQTIRPSAPGYADAYAALQASVDSAQSAHADIAAQTAHTEEIPTAEQLDDDEQFLRGLRLALTCIVVGRGRGSLDDRVDVSFWNVEALDDRAGILAA